MLIWPMLNAPLIHDGAPTSRLVGPKRGAHRLLQDQRQAPGREQRFQRPAVEEADDALLDQDADEARHHESQRHRDQQRIVEQPRAAGADVLLHHEGDVGADHHHLAVRHVDDAHHAEGDGKADRGEQQHRAEREPVPGVLHGGPDRELVLHRRHGVARGALHRGRRAGRQAGQQVQRLLVAARADRRLRRSSLSASEASSELRIDGGARFGQRLLDARRRFPSRARHRARAARSASRDLNTACAASKRLAGIGRLQAQAADRGIDARGAPGC